MRNIAAAVAERLGEPVPPSSIKSCLSREARSEPGSFGRIGRGRYCLRSRPPNYVNNASIRARLGSSAGRNLSSKALI